MLSRRAACHCANTTASDMGVPPVKTAPGASMFAPPSISASSTATSSLLAAQWSGVSGDFSGFGWMTHALTSAPAAMSAATVLAPFQKRPANRLQYATASATPRSHQRSLPLPDPDSPPTRAAVAQHRRYESPKQPQPPENLLHRCSNWYLPQDTSLPSLRIRPSDFWHKATVWRSAFTGC